MSAIESTRELVQRWKSARRVVVLTGAGLSTASGIPDFRSPGGRWEHYRPIPFPDFLASEQARREYWRYKGETWKVIRSAQPNAAHRALAELAEHGRVKLLVTQNVDGLHERSGFPAGGLINIHGTDSAVSCVDCGATEPRERAQTAWEAGEEVPLCACGAAFKPATISFGQQLVPGDLDRAMRAAGDCELFVAVGTSLVVSPINGMFDAAARSGAVTAILTASETPFDAVCDFRFSDPVQSLLPVVAQQVLAP